MRFDGPSLAHAWLAVGAASSTDKALTVLHRTVAIDEHTTGIRLTATDRTTLLTAWVPDLDHYYDTGEPGIAELPDRTVVAHDPDGRGRGMLGHVLSLANRIDPDDYTPGQIELDVEFDVRLPAGQAPETFEGMEPTYTVLKVKDVESVYLPVIEAYYPDWRQVHDAFTTRATSKVTFDPELLERLGKVRKHASGGLQFRLGGSGGMAAVLFTDSDPAVSGFLVPRQTGDVSEEECPTCSEGSFCLRHAASLVTAESIEGDES